MRRLVLALLGGALLALALQALAEEEPSGDYIARPLDAEILYPADGAAFRAANVTAVIEADGESVAFFSDSFGGGTLVNASLDASGIVANGSGPLVESYYLSPVFELPRVSPGMEWLWSLQYTATGGQGNFSEFFRIEVRFGDLTPGRNWSAWFEATIDGDFDTALGIQSDVLRAQGALQYEFMFLQPDNASNPHISRVEAWFIGHIERVEARLASDSAWTFVAADEGRYNVSFSLPEGNSTIEVRATDALGGVRTKAVNVSRDNTPPVIAFATPQGTSVPPDETAQVRFDGPMDTASALGVILVTADFPVDQIWTADNTTLIFSAQEAGKRGPVSVTIGPGLKDKAGNAFGQNVSYTYEMGTPTEAPPSSAPLLVALLGIVGIAAIAVMYMMGRAKKEREAYADEVRAEMDAEAGRPPKAP